MVCKNITLCEFKLSMKDFTEICAVTDVDRPGCPESFTHKKTPNDWRHYFRITHMELS